MTGNKKFDYEKAIENEKNGSAEEYKSIQDYVMKGLQILLGILMAILHA
ncbi:hypothetical protein MVI27_07340 [Chryseobacterium salipaludis]|nr:MULTISPECIES: hypothetical protein [Chryseobacterium]MCJ8498071.1 hypothetical protein [Chryseobacterium salipaludis]MCX3296730.1 hypothetical protein [Planobacterium sp. JC490]